MKILSCLVLGLGLAGAATAIPPFLDSVHKIVVPIKDSAYDKAGCLTCHAGNPPKLNSFGAQVKANLTGNKLTEAVLTAIAEEDADGDGAKNLAELKAGTLPGDAASKPDAPPPAPEAAPPIPKHAWHPLIVHFPIALFLFGAFLDLLGHIRRIPALRVGAVWNLGFGALASIGAVITGLVSRVLMEYPIEGTMRVHLVLGIASSVVMVGVAWWRYRKEPASTVYWLTLGFSCAVLTAAGHFGSMLVHG